MRKILAFTLLLLLAPSPAPACSLCGNLSRAVSLLHEFEQADEILYGRIANPKLEVKPGGLAGSGTTEFHIEKAVKHNPLQPRGQMILLSRYLPILDAKDPPRFVMFYRKGSVQPYSGREVKSPLLLDFVAALQRYRDNPTEMLLFAGKHLDHADPQIADEAFLAFARADDKLIGQVARKLAPDKLRTLIKAPELEPERLSMYAFLLGACGDASDLDLLRSFLKDTRNYKAFEGILAGYITMRPQEGWAYMHELVKNETTPFLLRYASLRTMRFFYNAKPEETGKQVMHGLGLALERADVADIAITDLRKWQRWQHTALILACYDKTSHRAPIVKNSIVRYALVCPQPEARTFIEQVRRQDPELVRYLEEELK